MMVINRRRLLALAGQGALLLASGSLGAVMVPAANESMSRRFAFVSALRQGDDYHLGFLDASGRLVYQLPLPGRGHSMAASPDGRWLVCTARRPGRWQIIIDLERGLQVLARESAPDRHFYGHSAFSPDGRYFVCTENAFDDGGLGVLGVYDVSQDFLRIAELPSFGIGPHDLAFLADNRTLVVANGGIQTHPDYGRTTLNLNSMAPALTYIDLPTEKHIQSLAPPDPLLSLRHLSVTADNHVAVAAQYQGAKDVALPLLFLHHDQPDASAGLTACTGMPSGYGWQIQQYMASVAILPKADRVITTAPRGDRFSVWSYFEARWLADVAMPDVAGVIAEESGDTALLSNGLGEVRRFDGHQPDAAILTGRSPVSWDNHLVRV